MRLRTPSPAMLPTSASTATAMPGMTGPELQRELIDKRYRHMRPGIEEQEWGMTTVTVIDPFNNRITFGEPTRKDAGADASD